MALSSSTYLPDFSVNLIFQPIHTNWAYYENKISHQKLLVRNLSCNCF